jgi:hypothetical protein
MMTEARRNELAALMDWLHEHGAQLNYPPQDHRTESVADIRSVAELKARVLRGALWDCSQTVYALLLAIGCPVRYPWGSTATLLVEPAMPHYSDPRAAYIGGLVIYGEGGGHHVTMTRHRDAVHGNPVQFGNGSNIGPTYASLHTVAAGQPYGVRLLSIAHL